VPGDVVVLKPGLAFCDMVVLHTDHVLVDERALTGEASPVLKVKVDPSMRGDTYNVAKHMVHTISAGTEILEVGDEDWDLGLVVSTGSYTSKGELLTEVLSYQRHKFKFDNEVKLVLVFLCMEAIILISLLIHFVVDDWVYKWIYCKSYSYICHRIASTRF
jgi:magnesium-transporting ATPase (P-type)